MSTQRWQRNMQLEFRTIQIMSRILKIHLCKMANALKIQITYNPIISKKVHSKYE